MLEIKYKENKYPSYRYDPWTNEVINIDRNNRPLKPFYIKNNFYLTLITLSGKRTTVNVKNISPDYANKFNALIKLSNVSMNTYDVSITDVVEQPEEKNPSVRDELLELMGLPSSYIWNTDIDTLVKAQNLIDHMSHEDIIYLEERSMYTMATRNIDHSRMCDVMVQIAATEILAMEEADTILYKKEYNMLTLEMLRKETIKFESPDLEKYIVENWKQQIRERFFFHIVYYNQGITLRGYTSIHIPLNTIEEIQSAYKLLTELFGWKGE